MIALYRCRTPTNVLCPCGAVERRLRKLGLDHRTERVPYKRRGRPEIEELTRQKRVPVLVDGDEVIHDSKRILEYLEWKYPKAERAAAEAEAEAGPQTGVAARDRAPGQERLEEDLSVL